MRVGIIGTGWGRMHIGGFRGAGAEVAALCGRDRDRTRDVAAQEGVAFATADVRELCDVVDAVVVASPDALHAAHVRLAMDAGRHVLCEKPFTVDASDADDLMRRAARRPDLVYAVNVPYRSLPPFAAARAWLAGRSLRTLEVSVRNHFLRGSEAFARTGDLGGVSHLIDTALWLTGASPSWVHAELLGDGSTAMHVGLATGALVTLVQRPAAEPVLWGHWAASGEGWELATEGGYVQALGGWKVDAVRAFTDGRTVELAAPLAPEPGRREPWAEAHVEVARAFLRAIEGVRSDALATFEEGALVQRVIAAARRANAEGRRVAFGQT